MTLKSIIATCIVLSSVAMLPAQANTATTVEKTTKASQMNRYEEMMTHKVWITTQALNQDKQDVPATDSHVANFFGLAIYNDDGTFTMSTLDGTPKLQGDWSFSEDGKHRSLTAKNEKGDVLFQRVVENVTVTPEEYTYRIYPSSEDTNVYFDIVHKVDSSTQ